MSQTVGRIRSALHELSVSQVSGLAASTLSSARHVEMAMLPHVVAALVPERFFSWR